MFSLVIVILSIALVAVLALAVMFYGGSAMGEGASKATAAKLINQGQQLLGAADLYKSDTGAWPTSIEQLVAEKYLQSAPDGHDGLHWVMPKPSVPTFVLEGVAKSSCQSVNTLAFRVDGVFDKPSAAYTAQCYSAGSDSFTVVVTKAGIDLTGGAACPGGANVAGLPGLGQVSCDAVPSDCEDPRWAIAPTSCGSSGGRPTRIPPRTPLQTKTHCRCRLRCTARSRLLKAGNHLLHTR